MPAPKGGNRGSIKKGEVRNTTGRPRKGESLTETMRVFLDDVPEGQELSYKDMFIKKSYEKAYEGDPTFAKLVWNYIDGMPVQKSELTGKDGERLIPIPILGSIAGVIEVE